VIFIKTSAKTHGMVLRIHAAEPPTRAFQNVCSLL